MWFGLARAVTQQAIDKARLSIVLSRLHVLAAVIIASYLIGAIPSPEQVLGIAGAHLHLYDKEPRPGRKVGHITIRGELPADVDGTLGAIRGLPGTYLEGLEA